MSGGDLPSSGGGGLLAGRPEPVRAQRRIWLISFTDFVCMTLAFFVMLYGMTEPDTQRIQALRTALGFAPVAVRGDANLDRGQATDLGYLARVLETQLASDPTLATITVRREGDQLVATLPPTLLFAPGSARIGPEGQAVLFTLGGLIANLSNAVEVVGHTDPTPLTSTAPTAASATGAALAGHAGLYPSNWELALARGRAVAAGLRHAGYLPAITVRGQADPLETELAPGETMSVDASRLQGERRVDVVIRAHGVGR